MSDPIKLEIKIPPRPTVLITAKIPTTPKVVSKAKIPFLVKDNTLKELRVSNCDGMFCGRKTESEIKIDYIIEKFSGYQASSRNMFRLNDILKAQIVDIRNIDHLNNWDGYFSLGMFSGTNRLTSIRLKVSEGLDLHTTSLDNASVSYLIENLEYPSHSDYVKNGGTLTPTIRLRTTSYNYFLSQPDLVQMASDKGYDVIS